MRGLPEALGELPTATLADEIETPGDGQIRALVTLAGNPCVSTPNADRLSRAIEQLDLYIALDVYVNETSRHADVILPGPTPLERPHYDLALYQLAVRNVANWTPAVLDTELPQEWETMLRLAGVAAGQGPNGDVAAFDDLLAGEVARGAGLDPAVAGERRGPERLLDLLLRAGPYELTLADLEAAPHGIDLGALKPRLPEALRTPSGRVELAPEAIVADVPRLRAELTRNGNGSAPEFVLIGRRQLRSNNSWMHNLTPLVKGKDRCTAWINPADAERLSIDDGASVSVRSRTGSVEIPVEVTPDIMPGVVSIPHGWGHDVKGARQSVAAAHPGVNSNILADETLLDEVSGNAVFNGIPVEVAPLA